MNSIALIIIFNVTIPVSLETANCFLPNPGNEGYLCHWEQKDFVMKNGKLVLRYESKNDNFFEKIARKRIYNVKAKKSI